MVLFLHWILHNVKNSEMLRGSPCVTRAGKSENFFIFFSRFHFYSHKPSLSFHFFSSIFSLLLCLFLCPCTLSLSHTHTHTHTLYMHYFCCGIQWPAGSSEDRLDCCWPGIKKYLMSPHTHARTHLSSMRLSTATFRYKNLWVTFSFVLFSKNKGVALAVLSGVPCASILAQNKTKKKASSEILFIRFTFSSFHLYSSCLAPRTFGQIAASEQDSSLTSWWENNSDTFRHRKQSRHTSTAVLHSFSRLWSTGRWKVWLCSAD